MIARYHSRLRRDAESVDVTAFLSLMVILIPFLLISTVLSQLAIIDLQVAQGESQAADVSDPLGLQLVVRSTVIELDHQQRQQPLLIDRAQGEKAWQLLAQQLLELKQRYPQSTAATVLLESQVSYEVLIRVVDLVRLQSSTLGSEPVAASASAQQQPLFPDLTLGEVSTRSAAGKGSP
ncbi:MAG: biopolymer transporter ExbD [Motiliproteus sp.]